MLEIERTGMIKLLLFINKLACVFGWVFLLTCTFSFSHVYFILILLYCFPYMVLKITHLYPGFVQFGNSS